jgi:hypothetical protein
MTHGWGGEGYGIAAQINCLHVRIPFVLENMQITTNLARKYVRTLGFESSLKLIAVSVFRGMMALTEEWSRI